MTTHVSLDFVYVQLSTREVVIEHYVCPQSKEYKAYPSVFDCFLLIILDLSDVP